MEIRKISPNYSSYVKPEIVTIPIKIKINIRGVTK